ncbi:MAG: glycosyltransferase [Deltaproteobacteria bacterium]|nr:glycosyltransferase [Deltaproteobacteria bacterium]
MTFKTGFDASLAHRMMAGADIFLMPSLYEPCGLTQMYALKYGTVPVVRGTGGLEDTVSSFDPSTGRGNGFKFYVYEKNVFLESFHQALNIFKDPSTWKKLMQNGMKTDFSWDRSAKEYVDIYKTIRK